MDLEKKAYDSSTVSPLDRVSNIFESILNSFKETPRDLQIKESDDKEVKLAKINAISNLQGQKVQAYTELISGGISIVQALINAKNELAKFEREFEQKIRTYNDKVSELKSEIQTQKEALKKLQTQSDKLFERALETNNYEVIDKVLELNNQIISTLALITHLNIESWKSR